MAPRLQRGCYCSLSLRACTITLASIHLILSLLNVIDAAVFGYDAFERPHEYAKEEMPDFDYPEDRWMEASHDRNWALLTALVLDSVFALLAVFDVVISSILIAGAAKRRAALIRPWLYLGAAFVVADIIHLVFHMALGSHISVFLPTIVHIPFAIYLWIVSWSLYLDCSEEARRHASPVSMSTLMEDGEEDGDPCSVAYATLEK